MNKIILIIVIIGIGVFLFLNNKKDSQIENDVIDSNRVMAPGEISLAVGGAGNFSNLSITFNELIADYRCPVDVQCIEAGAVVANITLKSDEEETTLNKPSDEVPLEFAGYKISVVDTNPPLLSKKVINPNDYVVTFLVEPIGFGENI